MATPGTIVNVATSANANNPPASTGVFFAIGQTARGAVGVATPVTSLAQYIALFGSRTANGATQTLYDALDIFFQEGGSQAYVSRVSGSSAVTANHTLSDRAGSPLSTLKISALGPGTWGNSITVAIANGSVSNTFVITVTNGSITEVSPNLYNPTQAVSWAASYSKTIRVTNLGSVTAAPNNNPAVISATSLTAGTDTTSPADATWVAALTAFSVTLGPGQVAAPARTTATVWEALSNHAQANNRYPLLDGPNVSTAATIVADSATVQGTVTDPSYGFMLAGWPIYSGPATGTATPPYPRTVAPSAAVAALMARSDAVSANADVAAAGNNGMLRSAIGVSQTYSTANRGTLDAAGIGVIRLYRGQVQLYGYTSMALNITWSDVGNCRLRMQIVDAVRRIGDGFEFADIDAKGHLASAFGGQISAFLNSLWSATALFGTTPADAFTVNVGPSVNTPVTAQARELIAQVAVRMSPTADQVTINVTRYPVTASLPS